MIVSTIDFNAARQVTNTSSPNPWCTDVLLRPDRHRRLETSSPDPHLAEQKPQDGVVLIVPEPLRDEGAIEVVKQE
jgi:hypothetical protein